MRAKRGILGMQVHNFLPNVWGQRAFILPRDLRWGFWWKQGGHSGLVKQVCFVVDGSRGHVGFRSALFGCLAPKNHWTNDLICNLSSILEQRTNLLPVLCRFSLLVPTFGHESPSSNFPPMKTRCILLKGILHHFGCLDKIPFYRNGYFQYVSPIIRVDVITHVVRPIRSNSSDKKPTSSMRGPATCFCGRHETS